MEAEEATVHDQARQRLFELEADHWQLGGRGQRKIGELEAEVRRRTRQRRGRREKGRVVVSRKKDEQKGFCAGERAHRIQNCRKWVKIAMARKDRRR